MNTCIVNVYGNFLAEANRRTAHDRVITYLRSQGVEPVAPPPQLSSKVETIIWAANAPECESAEYLIFHDADVLVDLDIIDTNTGVDCIQPYAYLRNNTRPAGEMLTSMPYGPPCWVVRREHLRRVLRSDAVHREFKTSWGDFYIACVCAIAGTYKCVEKTATHLDHPRGDQRANVHELAKMRHELRSQRVRWPDHEGIQRLRDFLDIPKPRKEQRTGQTGGRGRRTARAARRAAHGATSAAKTAVGIDRLPENQIQQRLDVCRRCPGHHAVWKKDGSDVHTCGPMLDSIKRAGQGTCGCVLAKKARDAKERCPFGYWPTVGSK